MFWGRCMSWDIDLPVPDLIGRVRDVKRKQIPFATALALTVTAADGQKAVRKTLGQRFILRSKWVSAGIRTKKATKRKLQSVVFSRDKFMADHEKGGVRTPRGVTFAIPRKVRKDKRRKITKGQKPKAVLARKNVFVGKTNTGKPAIYKKVGKAGRLVILYFLHRGRVRLKPRLRMKETVRAVTRKVWKKNFGRAFARALRTAR